MAKVRKIAIGLCSFGLVLMMILSIVFNLSIGFFAVKVETAQTNTYNAEFFSSANTYDATLTETNVRGGTIIYSYLQAIGTINSHEDNCYFNNKKI